MWRDVDNAASAGHAYIQVLPVGMSSRTLWRLKIIIKKRKAFQKCPLWLEDKLIWSGEKASCLEGFMQESWLIVEVKGHHSHIPQIDFKLRGVFDLEFNKGTPNIFIIEKKKSVTNSTTMAAAALFFWIIALFSLCRNARTHGATKAMSRPTKQVFIFDIQDKFLVFVYILPASARECCRHLASAARDRARQAS